MASHLKNQEMLSNHIIGHAKSEKRNRITAKLVPLPNRLDHQITGT
jgi:hypothetical protein